jgi:hypothetical protein
MSHAQPPKFRQYILKVTVILIWKDRDSGFMKDISISKLQEGKRMIMIMQIVATSSILGHRLPELIAVFGQNCGT